MKTFQALATLAVLGEVAGTRTDTPLKFAYAAVRNIRKLNEFAELYEKSRVALLKQFAKLKEDGELFVDDKGMAEIADKEGFVKAVTALNEEDIPDLKLHQVSLADFPATIDLAKMDALMPMVLEAKE